jgi:hypothetical protein
MLVRNGYVNACHPNRFFTGLATTIGSYAQDRANFSRTGENRNWFAGEATTDAAYPSAFPNGYNPESSWIMAQIGGGMATYNTILGTADLVGSGNYGRDIAADLAGLGDITNAALSLIAGAVAAITATGDLTADIQGALNAVADLVGSGDLVGALGAIAGLVAALDGDGTITSFLSGNGNMSANINVTGDVLNTANVGQAVFSYLISAGYTAQEILSLLAAVAAGKTSIIDLGGGAAEVTFRNLEDDTDAVVADMSGSERTNVTIDLT